MNPLGGGEGRGWRSGGVWKSWGEPLGLPITHLHTNTHTSCTASRGFGWRIHSGVKVTESSTNKKHSRPQIAQAAPVPSSGSPGTRVPRSPLRTNIYTTLKNIQDLRVTGRLRVANRGPGSLSLESPPYCPCPPGPLSLSCTCWPLSTSPRALPPPYLSLCSGCSDATFSPLRAPEQSPARNPLPLSPRPSTDPTSSSLPTWPTSLPFSSTSMISHCSPNPLTSRAQLLALMQLTLVRKQPPPSRI